MIATSPTMRTCGERECGVMAVARRAKLEVELVEIKAFDSTGPRLRLETGQSGIAECLVSLPIGIRDRE